MRGIAQKRRPKSGQRQWNLMGKYKQKQFVNIPADIFKKKDYLEKKMRKLFNVSGHANFILIYLHLQSRKKKKGYKGEGKIFLKLTNPGARAFLEEEKNIFSAIINERI